MEPMVEAVSTSVEDLGAYLLRVFVEPPARAALKPASIGAISRVAPARPGIYAIFYANAADCLYVGSSINPIRSRLLTHFRKDAEENYRGKLSALREPQGFCFWFYEITRPVGVDRQHFKCVVNALEAVCSAAWKPEVTSRKF